MAEHRLDPLDRPTALQRPASESVSVHSGSGGGERSVPCGLWCAVDTQSFLVQRLSPTVDWFVANKESSDRTALARRNQLLPSSGQSRRTR
jgi:hypothetical protein